MANFKKMKSLTTDRSLILKAICNSDIVEVSKLIKDLFFNYRDQVVLISGLLNGQLYFILGVLIVLNLAIIWVPYLWKSSI